MSELEIPERLVDRPRARGFVVPWFVGQLDDGSYDFRTAEASKIAIAVRGKLCWMCGQPIGRFQVFIVGPMCAINRTSAEPPSHRDCAEYAAAVCPFLVQREGKRRTVGTDVGQFDVRQATELGAALLYDKPLLLVVPPGRTIGNRLRRAADVVIDDFDPAAPESQERMTAAVRKLTFRSPG